MAYTPTPPPAWAALLEVSRDALALLDDGGRVIWANTRLHQITGLSAPETVGQAIVQLLAPPEGWPALAQVLRCGPAVDDQPITWRDAQGSRHAGRLTCRMLSASERHGAGSVLFGLHVNSAQEPPQARHAPLTDGVTDTLAELELVAELGKVAVWRHDLSQDRLFYNDRGYKLLGLTPRRDGIPAAEVRAMIHPDDQLRVRSWVAQALHVEEPVDVEARYRRPDGQWVNILTRRVVRRDSSGAPVEYLGVGLDITAQMERLREANEEAESLRTAILAAGVGVWSRDPQQPRAHWNDEMFRITGRAKQLGEPTRDEWVEEIVHPDDRAAIRAGRAAVTADAVMVEHECRIVRPDGEVRWLVNRARREVRGNVSQIYGVTIDVTERVLAEMALHRVNERVALAARSVGIGTWEWDLETGDAEWDEAMFRLRGMTPHSQRLAVEEGRAMTHPDDLERVRLEFHEIARSAEPASQEFRVVRPDGSVRWLASRSTVMLDEQGRPTRRIGVNWDVTDTREADQRRQAHELALRESHAKSEFLSRMSHELRTPLNAVLGFAQLLLIGEAPLQPAQRTKLAHIQAAGEHLLSLIDDVLDLSRLESTNLRLDLLPVALGDVMREALPLVETLAKNHHIQLQTPALQGVVIGDRTRLRQLLLNLLSNAIKYNRAGGQVIVTTTLKGDQVELSVQDTGLGMTPEQLTHLYEPFNRLGRERDGIEGTGIGLAVVKALVKRMNGTIEVSSRPGVGSTFSILLPSATPTDDDTTAPAVVIQPPHAPPLRQGRVLYIEDNPVNVLLVEELLAMRPGLTLSSAGTGLAGVSQALKQQPDLILIDIQLPDIDGFEVLRRLREQGNTAHIPCVALSANAMPIDIARARQAGFRDYLTKPIDFTRFLTALDGHFPPV